MTQQEDPPKHAGTLSGKVGRKVGEALGEDWRDDVARGEAQAKFSGWPRHLPKVRQAFMVLHFGFMLSALGVLAYQSFRWISEGAWPRTKTLVVLKWIGVEDGLFLSDWPLALSLFLAAVMCLVLGILWLRFVEDPLYGPFDGDTPPGYTR